MGQKAHYQRLRAYSRSDDKCRCAEADRFEHFSAELILDYADDKQQHAEEECDDTQTELDHFAVDYAVDKLAGGLQVKLVAAAHSVAAQRLGFYGQRARSRERGQVNRMDSFAVAHSVDPAELWVKLVDDFVAEGDGKVDVMGDKAKSPAVEGAAVYFVGEGVYIG